MKNPLKIGILCAVLSLMIGCGTVNTVIRDDSMVQYKLNQARTPCETIPRIYSGVAYDICMLRSEPIRTPSRLDTVADWVVVDLPLSGILDTVALPMTIFWQIRAGSIPVQ